MTEEIIINRNTLFLTIDNVRIETQNGIEEKDDQYVAFLKGSEPNSLNFGEQVKDSDGENIVFYSPQQAKDYIVAELKKSIYPPDFLNPIRYTKENLSEIMHKKLFFDIGQVNSADIEETFEGTMIECFLAANPPNLPVQAKIINSNRQELNVDFFSLKRIRRT